MEKHWNLIKPHSEYIERIRRILNCSPVTAAVLVNRNILSESDLLNFTDLSLKRIRPPFSIKDMDAAVQRIIKAILSNEKILIFGDYDADGVTATTILLEFLQYTGADVSFYIPHRTKEGYDLQAGHIFGYALAKEIDLIITVDCGSSRHEAVQAALDSGIDIIITDHHTVSKLPPAIAVINPRRPDCTADFEHLAGVGVAFALIICLRKQLREINFWKNRPEPNLKNLCDLVAIGTVADMVPLVHENRIFSKVGLDVINTGRRPGINALLKASGITKSQADTDDIAFRLAPRINAAGRMEHAGIAVELLRTDNPGKAEKLALSLNDMNKKRQDIEKRMLKNILKYLEKHPHILEKKTLVLSNPKWHEGILGIAASKLVEKFFKPVVLISTKNHIAKGSGRSIPGINIYEGFKACSSHFDKFGGHPMAVGLQIHVDNIEAFQKDFENAVSHMVSSSEFSKEIYIDYELDFKDISDKLIDELESLHPFGEGNPEPLFMTKNIWVSSSWIVGKHHRRMVLRQSRDKNDKAFNAIHFNIDRNQLEDNFERIAYRLRWNRWNGGKTAQIIIEET